MRRRIALRGLRFKSQRGRDTDDRTGGAPAVANRNITAGRCQNSAFRSVRQVGSILLYSSDQGGRRDGRHASRPDGSLPDHATSC